LKARDPVTPVLFEVDNAARVRWVITDALKTLDPKLRARIVLNVIHDVADITVLSDLARSLIGDLHPVANNVPNEQFFGNSDEERLIRNSLLERVRNLAATGAIWAQAEPRQIIWFWWGSDLENEVRAFTARAMRTKIGLRALLDLTVNQVQASGGNYERVKRSSVEHIVDVEALESQARRLLKRKNSPEADKAIARRFLDALQRGDSNNF
jgi:hypothetical protein